MTDHGTPMVLFGHALVVLGVRDVRRPCPCGGCLGGWWSMSVGPGLAPRAAAPGRRARDAAVKLCGQAEATYVAVGGADAEQARALATFEDCLDDLGHVDRAAGCRAESERILAALPA